MGVTNHDQLLRAFVRESNRIEGISRQPRQREIDAHAVFLGCEAITIGELVALVSVLAPGKPLRSRPGMNVRVGNHMPPPGGPNIEEALALVLSIIAEGHASAYDAHHAYETLHPFMDGNGRSGRALWLWMMLRAGTDPYALSRGFLHTWYYQSLSAQNRSGGSAEGATRATP